MDFNSDFFKEIQAWAGQQGFEWDDNKKYFYKEGQNSKKDRKKVEDIVKDMTEYQIKQERDSYLEEGYKFDSNGKLRKNGKFISSTDKVAQKIEENVNAKMDLIKDSKKLEEIAFDNGWSFDAGTNKFQNDGKELSPEEMKLKLLKDGAFRTQSEIYQDTKTNIVTELDKIKNASLKIDPKLSAQQQAIEAKLKKERRSRLRLLAGAVVGVGLIAASGGLLAPVAGTIIAGGAVAGSALTTLGLTGVGLLAGAGLTAGFGTRYGIKVYNYFRDPTQQAARVSNKLAKHMERVHEYEQRFDQNLTPRQKRLLEAKLKKENEYAAKQAAKAAKQRDRAEKRAENSYAEKLFGYCGFADTNARRAELYGQISDLLESNINNNNNIAEKYGLDMKAVRGKSAQIVNKAHTKSETLSTVKLTESDMTNNEMVSKMMEDYIQAHSDEIVAMGIEGAAKDKSAIFGSTQGFEDIVNALIERNVITKDFAYGEDGTIKPEVQKQIALKSLGACKYSQNFNANNREARKFMKGCVIEISRLNEKDLETMTQKDKDLVYQIYGPEIVSAEEYGNNPDGKRTGFLVDNREAVQAMQQWASSGTNYEKQKDMVQNFKKTHSITGQVKMATKNVAQKLDRAINGPTTKY